MVSAGRLRTWIISPLTQKTWIFWTSVCLLLAYLPTSGWAKTTAVKTKEQLDPATVKVLSGILDSLDAFTNHRLKDLENIRLANPNTTIAVTPKQDTMSFDGVRRKSNITDSIKALKDGIMSHRPVKKTFGYKVTVYTSPIEDGGKDGKPVLVTQYVGGDIMPEKPDPISSRSGDLDESGNHPQADILQTSLSAPYGVQVGKAAGAEHVANSEAASDAGGLDHERKTEHQASSEKGHQKSLSEKSTIEKGHDKKSHRENAGEHLKEVDKEAHRHDTHAHDRGGATQQGIRERTEIEYYEREHFLDTEYDKAKGGHAKSSGLKEHESHSDKDTHDRKREHNVHDSKSTEHEDSAKSSAEKSHDVAAHQKYDPSPHDYSLRPDHYSPPYGAHHQQEGGAAGHSQKIKNDGSYNEENKEETSGLKEVKSQRDHDSKHEDHGHHEKDNGRRKEGYRERGYKITAEREYFLNDAHHDTGHGSHTSGEKVRDKEGARHGSKEGEEDKGFVKEQKSHDSHDAAYDAKERKYHDGEKHSEGFSKTSASDSEAAVEEEKHHKAIPHSEHAGVVYSHHSPTTGIRKLPIPLYPHPVPYEAAGEKSHVVVAQLPKKQATIIYGKPRRPQRINSKAPASFELGSAEDNVNSNENGYVGYASYKRKNNPLIADIRDSVRRNVKAPPPSYATTTITSKTLDISDENNDVKYNDPDSKEEYEKSAEVRQYGSHLGPQPEKYRRPPSKHDDSESYNSEEDVSVYFPENKSTKRYPEEILKTYSQEELKPYPQEESKPYHPKPTRQHHYRRPKPLELPPEEYLEDHQRYRQPVNRPPSRYQNYRPHEKSQTATKQYANQPYSAAYQTNGGTHQQELHPELADIGQAALSVLFPKQGNVYVRQQPRRIEDSQGKPPYSPVVLLSHGPPSTNPAVDVWYTRQPNRS